MNIQLMLLQSLDAVDPLMLPFETLCADARLRGAQASRSEIQRHVGELESKRQVTVVTSEDAPGGSRLKITDAGKARLAEAVL